jgi:hypothetical protein
MTNYELTGGRFISQEEYEAPPPPPPAADSQPSTEEDLG